MVRRHAPELFSVYGSVFAEDALPRIQAQHGVADPRLFKHPAPAVQCHIWHYERVEFAQELDSVLPADLPHRDSVIGGCARHLELIVEINKVMNLTRIVSPREAAIKHVLDSVVPWRLFEGASHVLDAGTGAGFPGIPLALVLPETRFTLAESIQKKARFVADAVKALGLANVDVRSERAEALKPPPIVTARAMAPTPKLIDLFKPAQRQGARLLFYKGPEETEHVIMRYELPEGMGSRTIIEL